MDIYWAKTKSIVNNMKNKKINACIKIYIFVLFTINAICFGDDNIGIQISDCNMLDSIIEQARQKLKFELKSKSQNEINLMRPVTNKNFDINLYISCEKGSEKASFQVNAFKLSNKTGKEKLHKPWTYIWEDIIRQEMGQMAGLSTFKLKNSILFHSLKFINPPVSVFYLLNNNPLILKRHAIVYCTIFEAIEISSIALLINEYRNYNTINPIGLTWIILQRFFMLFIWGDINSEDYKMLHESGYLFRQRF